MTGAELTEGAEVGVGTTTALGQVGRRGASGPFLYSCPSCCPCLLHAPRSVWYACPYTQRLLEEEAHGAHHFFHH